MTDWSNLITPTEHNDLLLRNGYLIVKSFFYYFKSIKEKKSNLFYISLPRSIRKTLTLQEDPKTSVGTSLKLCLSLSSTFKCRLSLLMKYYVKPKDYS